MLGIEGIIMLSRVRLCLGTALAAAALSVTSAGFAATTLDIVNFDRSALTAAQAARSAALSGFTIRGYENFQDYQAWNGSTGSTDPQDTRVGSFDPFGDTGSGLSVVGDGGKLQVRNDPTMPWGRYGTSETLPLGGNWLDSNDNLGIRWDIAGIGSFDSLAFFVLDAADVGGKFSIKVGDTLFADIAGATGKLKNGNIQFVRVLLSEAVESLTVELMHDRTNDGFGIDGAAVALSPVPLPPAVLLLATGLAGLAGLRRRARRAA